MIATLSPYQPKPYGCALFKKVNFPKENLELSALLKACCQKLPYGCDLSIY
jgi:hypothetical protein